MKNIIITGAGSGLGAALAEQYAAAGFHIILLGRTEKKLKQIQDKIVANGGAASTVTCNIAVQGDVKQTIETIVKEHGIIYGVINNAGVGHFGPLENLPLQDINEMIDTNVKGTIFLTSEVLPHFKAHNSGKIINIISTAGLKGKVNESVYVASKFAVRGFTESLVKELENTNIEVTAVYMGGMATPFWDESDHIKDPSRLKDAAEVAKQIISEDDGKAEILINR
jgi:uncharacterized protein